MDEERTPDSVSYIRLLRALNGRMVEVGMPEEEILYIAQLVRELVELNNEVEFQRRQWDPWDRAA